MNKKQIINVIKKYLADKFECDISDLDKKGLNIVKNKQDSKLKMLLFYDFKLFDGNTDEINLSNGFENAITFDDGKCISDIAYCAYKDGQVIGVAGADKINDDIWEVGIEVLPEYRKDGLATILTKNLTLKILEKGIVPIWSASVSNIGSQAVATNSDYIPLWMETFGDIFEENYVFKDITKNIEI